MGSRSPDAVRRPRPRAARPLTARGLLATLALVALAGSAAYWWGVQSQLTSSRAVAAAFTAILTLAPPSLVSFLIPWSPGGMLLQQIHARTWGYAAAVGAALFLLAYSIEVQLAWWAAQPVVAGTGLILQQVILGLIGFIVVPALLWAPVSREELAAQVRQAHLVRRYELQTQADIAILRATLLRAQEQALVGFANLTPQERQELAAVLRALVRGIDQTLADIGAGFRADIGAVLPLARLDDDPQIRRCLDLIEARLTAPPRTRRRADG